MGNSGNSINGSGSHIELISGKGTSKEGADAVLYAGETSGAEGVGGKVRILGGKGTSDDRFNGGDGGDIELKAGEGVGRHGRIDNGGNIKIQGGNSKNTNGGSINLQSGLSSRSTSGSVHIATSNSAEMGVSGSMSLGAGVSFRGTSD